MTVEEAANYLLSNDKFPDRDEPVFVLRGRDVLAYQSVREWAMRAIHEGVNTKKIQDALSVAAEIAEYHSKKIPD